MRNKPDTDYPKIAVDSLIQRASDIVAACRRDQKELSEAGFDWNSVEKLNAMISPCTDIEAEYRLQKETSREKTVETRNFMLRCCTLRDTLIKAVRASFTLTGFDDTLPDFTRSRDSAGVVQDLSDISVFCRLNAEQLKKTPFDFQKVDEAKRAVYELADALAENEYRKSLPSEHLENRNRLCKELHEAMVAICVTGRYVFRKDPLRRKAYRIR